MKAEYKLVCPRGWRFLRVGEWIRPGDFYCNPDENEKRWYVTGERRRKFTNSWRSSNGSYIRRIGARRTS